VSGRTTFLEASFLQNAINSAFPRQKVDLFGVGRSLHVRQSLRRSDGVRCAVSFLARSQMSVEAVSNATRLTATARTFMLSASCPLCAGHRNRAQERGRERRIAGKYKLFQHVIEITARNIGVPYPQLFENLLKNPVVAVRAAPDGGDSSLKAHPILTYCTFSCDTGATFERMT
jgi:hypothetical protein